MLWWVFPGSRRSFFVRSSCQRSALVSFSSCLSSSLYSHNYTKTLLCSPSRSTSFLVQVLPGKDSTSPILHELGQREGGSCRQDICGGGDPRTPKPKPKMIESALFKTLLSCLATVLPSAIVEGSYNISKKR